MNTNIFASTSATSTTPTADFEIHTSTVDSMAIRSESAAMLPVTPQKPSRAALNNSSSIVLASPGHPLKLDLKLNRANNKVMNDSRLQPPSPRSRSSSIKRQRSRIFSSADTDAPGYTYDPYNQLSDFRASKRFRSNSMPMHTQPCQELNASIFLQGDLNHHNLSSTLSSSPSSSHSSSIRRSVSCDSGPAITFGMENRGRFHDLSSPFRSEYLHQHQFQHQHQRKTSSFNRSASDTSSIGSFDSTSDDDSNSSLCGRSSRAITPVSVSVPVSSPTPEFVHQQIELDVPSPPAKVRTSSSLSSMSPLSSIQETLPRVPDDNVMAADLFNEGASFFHPLPSIDLPLDSMASDSFDHLSSSFDFGIVDNISRDMNKEKEREKQCSQAPQMPVDDPFFDFLMPISSMSSYVPVV